MEKVSGKTKGVSSFDISVLINNTALVNSTDNRSGLYNIKTNKLIGMMDNYRTIYNNQDMIYAQVKEKEDVEDIGDFRYIRIYDAKEEKMLIDNLRLDKSFDSDYHFCSLVTKDRKRYIFNSILFRNKDIKTSFYDDVEILYRNREDDYLVVSLNGKKGIYSKNRGEITELVYDNIECIDGILIFTMYNRKGFASVENYKGVDLCFDDVKVEDGFIYVRDRGYISLYNLYDLKLLYTDRCEEIKHVKSHCNWRNAGQHFFVKREICGYGLIKIDIDYNYSNGKSATRIDSKVLLDNHYDSITYNGSDGVFYIKQNSKIGLLCSLETSLVFISAYYDKIVKFNDGFYGFYVGNDCYISRIEKKFNPVVSICEIVDTSNGGIIFKQYNKYGLLTTCSGKDTVMDGYDNIRGLGYGYFELEKDGKKGVYYDGSIIIPLKYKYIEFHYHNDDGNDKYVCFSLSSDKKRYKLAFKKHLYYEKSELEYSPMNGLLADYREIKFLPDVILLRNLYGLFICDYKNNILKKFSSNTNVSMLIKNLGCCTQKALYHIGNEYYFYKDGKFELALIEERGMYVTAYESEYGVVVVNSFDESDHNRKCEQIENDGDITFDKKLITYYDEHPEIYEKYPTLVKKKTL